MRRDTGSGRTQAPMVARDARPSVPPAFARSRRTVRAPTPDRERTALLVLEVTTAAAALLGGASLLLAPDGSLLRLDPALLAGTPLRDWRIPGVLLTSLIGGGFLVTGAALWSGVRAAGGLSVAAGVGLVLFEAVELAWIGPHPLQAVFGIVGAAVVVLALRRGADGTGPMRASRSRSAPAPRGEVTRLPREASPRSRR